MYYYYRVAEELVFVVFVLPSRCANSLKRTPPPPPPPPPTPPPQVLTLSTAPPPPPPPQKKKCLIKKLTHNPLPFCFGPYLPSVSLLGILR